MKVSELISELATKDQEAQVVIYSENEDDFYSIKSVTVDPDETNSTVVNLVFDN